MASHEFAAFVGIDWGDQKHAVCLRSEGVEVEHELPQRAAEIEAWARELRTRFGGRPVAVCLEQSRGPLIYALLKYEFLVLFPLNPLQATRYREALYPSGSKDDPLDARLLCRFVETHHGQLRAWQPDDEATRLLRLLAEDRRRFVDQRTAHKNQLRQRLKEFFPLALELLRGGDLEDEWFLQLLIKFPSHAELRRASPRTLERMLPKHHRLPDEEPLDPRVAQIRAAVPLVTDGAVVKAGRLQVMELARLILRLNTSIAEYDRELAAELARHPEAELFRSFPGAGAALLPRLAAAFGTNRERYADAQELQQLSGIAPVQIRSGKSCSVRRRRACPKFLRQTFHEYADHSRKRSLWAKAYYRMLRGRGLRHNAAVRALAFKWLRILFRCWQTRTPYDEHRHLAQLRLKQSPLLQFLDLPNPAEQT
jgi:transposase